jgi:glycosyltransferase involved in cell wall biosynthesis
MNIGFEAKRAFANGTGLGHYSRTLISSLATYFNEHEYFLFTPKKTSLFNTDDYANVHTVTPTTFPSTIFTAAWRSSWVKKDLNKLAIDVYHGLSHEIPIGIQHSKIPSVVTMHDLIFERNPEQYKAVDVKIYRQKFKYACINANHVIAISQQTKDDLIQFYRVPEQKISICYQSCNPAFANAVSDEEKQRIKNLYQLPDNFYLYVGSIIERKNLLTICKALHILGNKNDIPLVVIGNGGSYLQTVKKYIAEKGLQDKVIFLSDKFNHVADFKTAADFPAIYQQALCMIYPSFFEGFGIPVLEALWSKIPVITSNVSCMPETGGDAAFYVNPSNENEMANAMQQVANDTILRSQMIEKGLTHANNFTQQKCAAAVMKVYEQL